MPKEINDAGVTQKQSILLRKIGQTAKNLGRITALMFGDYVQVSAARLCCFFLCGVTESNGLVTFRPLCVAGGKSII